MALSLGTAYRSFGGEVEASSTPTICRLPDSRRHQLWAIAPQHAREIVPFFRTCAIIRFTVDEDDGVLMPTPSNDQPKHHTYWKKIDVQIPTENFALVIGPDK